MPSGKIDTSAGVGTGAFYFIGDTYLGYESNEWAWNLKKVVFDSNTDNGSYGNPTAGHTGEEIRPVFITFTPLIFY